MRLPFLGAVAALMLVGGCSGSSDQTADEPRSTANAAYTSSAGDYLGCFVDSENRTLPFELGTGHTVESCLFYASRAGFAYAGLQYYGYCFAGYEGSATQVGDQECNTPCTAYPNETCGGVWRNSVYRTAAPGGGPWNISYGGSGTMTAGSGVRGCSDYHELSPHSTPTADQCEGDCRLNGANACEWDENNGNCYIEYGRGCSVQGGFPGWYARVF